jgi:hypothetical protein
MPRFTRAIAGALTALTLCAPAAVVSTVAAPAQARPIACDIGDKQIEIVSMRRPVFLTHVRGYHAPPGGKLTISKTISSTGVISASAEIYGEVSSEAGAVFAKVSGKAGFKVAGQGSKTNTSSTTVTNELGASNRDRYYAAYVATTKVKGDFRRRQCRSDQQGMTEWRYGTYVSFRRTVLEGIALCKQGRYNRGTAPFAACRATWGN